MLSDYYLLLQTAHSTLWCICYNIYKILQRERINVKTKLKISKLTLLYLLLPMFLNSNT